MATSPNCFNEGLIRGTADAIAGNPKLKAARCKDDSNHATHARPLPAPSLLGVPRSVPLEQPAVVTLS